MIELRSIEQLTKAIERARAGKLSVKFTSIYRQYKVTNLESGAEYIVNFFIRDGRRYAHCTCKAGENNMLCKHVAAAAGLHVMVAANPQQIAALSPKKIAALARKHSNEIETSR